MLTEEAARDVALLDAVGIHAAYGARTVLRGVCLRVTRGETVALLGCNGSGKTTLLRVLSGQLAPARGHVTLSGQPLVRLRPRDRAHRLAVLAQRPLFLPDMPVRDFVLLGRYARLSGWGVYSAVDRGAAEAALEEVGAAELACRRMRELSGGEVQRVALARTLAQETPLLLLDELSAALDAARAVALFDVLECRRRRGTAIVMAIHDCSLAALYATRLVGLRKGGILFDGAVPRVFTEENLAILYGTPMRVVTHPGNGLPQALLARTCGPFATADAAAVTSGGRVPRFP